METESVESVKLVKLNRLHQKLNRLKIYQLANTCSQLLKKFWINVLNLVLNVKVKSKDTAKSLIDVVPPSLLLTLKYFSGTFVILKRRE